MANVITTIRTNEFKIKAECISDFKNLIDNVESEDFIHVDVIPYEDDNYFLCNFASYGDIYGLYDEEADDYEYDEFLIAIQKMLTDDTVFKMISNMHEKLRFVDSHYVVMTKDKIHSGSVWDYMNEFDM